MDDVEDDSQLRRGIPGGAQQFYLSFQCLLHLTVAHKIYGVPQAINTANYVYFLAYKELFALRDPGNANQRLEDIVNGNIATIRSDCRLTDPSRRILESASRPRTRSILARQPHLSNRGRVHRYGEQQ